MKLVVAVAALEALEDLLRHLRDRHGVRAAAEPDGTATPETGVLWRLDRKNVYGLAADEQAAARSFEVVR